MKHDARDVLPGDRRRREDSVAAAAAAVAAVPMVTDGGYAEEYPMQHGT